jgi:hypothetical protein
MLPSIYKTLDLIPITEEKKKKGKITVRREKKRNDRKKVK